MIRPGCESTKTSGTRLVVFPHLTLARSIESSQTELAKSGSGKILKRLLPDAAWARQERAVAWPSYIL